MLLYEARDEEAYSRHRPGLQHIAFSVATRADVDAIHDRVRGRKREVLHAPQVFPQFGEDYYAVYFLDPHGFKLEVVCPTAEGEATS